MVVVADSSIASSQHHVPLGTIFTVAQLHYHNDDNDNELTSITGEWVVDNRKRRMSFELFEVEPLMRTKRVNNSLYDKKTKKLIARLSKDIVTVYNPQWYILNE